MAAVLAYGRIGAGHCVTFTVVGVALSVLAVGVAADARWATVIAVALLGGQCGAVVGTVADLASGVDAGKAATLRRLGFDPTVGVVINLAYSTIAAAVFGWWWRRWAGQRRQSRADIG